MIKLLLSLTALYKFSSAQPWIPASPQAHIPLPPGLAMLEQQLAQATSTSTTSLAPEPIVVIPQIPEPVILPQINLPQSLPPVVIPQQPVVIPQITLPQAPPPVYIPAQTSVPPPAVVLPQAQTSTSSTTSTTTTLAPEYIPAVVLPQINLPQAQSTSTTLAPDSIAVAPQTPDTTLPLLPPGSRYGAYGQICGLPEPSSQCLTTMPPSFAYGTREGFMRCDRVYDCCLCAQVTCHNCNTFSAGISGIYGVKNVQINGRDPAAGGASIACLGVESCAESVINGQYIKSVVASNPMAMQNAHIIITDPVEFFQIDCSAMGSCEGLDIELVFPGPPPGSSCTSLLASITPFYVSGVHCSAQDSCKDMKFTVRNDGCKRVIIQDLVCVATGSCTNAAMELIGEVVIENCDLGPSGATMLGVDKCYENLRELLCPDPRSCVGQTRTLLNPVQGFAMKCGGSQSCAGAQFTIELTHPYNGALQGRPGGAVEHLDGFWFSGPHSAAGATITINNQQGGAAVVIERIECGTTDACTGTTFIIGANVNVNDIECGTNNACRGCVVKYFAADPGFPCDPSQV